MDRSLRLQIAEAQIKIKELKIELATAEASTEKSTIDAAGGMKALGSNEAERKAALAYAVADSPICRKLQRDIATAEGTLLRLEAAHGDQQDDAQRERWRVRSRLCDALEALGMAQPADFFSGAEVERTAENIFDTMVSAAAKNGLEAATEAATAPGDVHVLYNTGRHVVAVRGAAKAMGSMQPAMDRLVAAAPATTPAAAAYRAEAARRLNDAEWQSRQEQADELFGD